MVHEFVNYSDRLQPKGVCDESFRRYVLPRLAGLRVLDVGCGQGTYLAHFSKGSVGVDLSAKNVEACNRRGFESYRVDDAHKLPLEDAEFDCVLLSHVLEHVPNPVRMLREAGRVLKTSGLLVLGLPLEGTLACMSNSYFDDHPGHLYAFSEVNADRLLRICGFLPSQLYYFVRGINRFRLGALLPAFHLLPRAVLRQFSTGFWIVARKIYGMAPACES